MSTAAVLATPTAAPDPIACRHCTQDVCQCPALPCAGSLGEPCADPRPTTLRNDKDEPECTECFTKRRKARCWR